MEIDCWSIILVFLLAFSIFLAVSGLIARFFGPGVTRKRYALYSIIGLVCFIVDIFAILYLKDYYNEFRLQVYLDGVIHILMVSIDIIISLALCLNVLIKNIEKK